MSSEINSLLSTDAIRGSKSLVLFESNTKEIKEKLSSSDIQEKIDALNELFEVFSNCFSISD